jgi:HEPN domain-containing protein
VEGGEEVQRYQDLSLEYLDLARIGLEAGRLAPARHTALHALELGVKAALAARAGAAPRTHNVGGEFGKHFREIVGQETTRRINKLLQTYDGPRYPDWDAPTTAQMEDDLDFISTFLTATLPKLLEARA